MTFQFPYAQHQGPEAGFFKNLPTSCLRYQGGHFPMGLGIVQLSYQLPKLPERHKSKFTTPST